MTVKSLILILDKLDGVLAKDLELIITVEEGEDAWSAEIDSVAVTIDPTTGKPQVEIRGAV